MRHLRFASLSAAVGLAGGLFVGGADAQERAIRVPPPPPRPIPTFSVALEDGAGSRLRTFTHNGTTFVLGEEGARYVIVVTNPTPRRVEAVVSVDGRDAVSGGVADFRRQRGYLVPAFGSVRIEGFRQSLERVATFRFTPPHDAYSSRMGTPENVGIIGVAFFNERDAPAIARNDDERRPAPPRDAPTAKEKAASGAPAPAAPAARRAREADGDAAGRLGTEYGESRTSAAVGVPFERASASPARIVTMRYDDAEGLVRRGIAVFDRFDDGRRRALGPQAFPASRFAPPPP